MASNNVVLVGRLTRDPEVRTATSGISVCSFTVAVDRALSKEKRSDPNVQTADFVRCVAYRGTADFMKNYCHQGNRVSISGRLQSGSYEDQDGKKIYTLNVAVNELHLETDRRTTDDGNAQDLNASNYQNNRNTSNPSPAATTYPENSNNANNYSYGNLNISADDLPF